MGCYLAHALPAKSARQGPRIMPSWAPVGQPRCGRPWSPSPPWTMRRPWGVDPLLLASRSLPVRGPFCWRHVNAKSGSQIDFVLLLLRDDSPQRLAQRELTHRLGLLDSLAVSPHRFPFVLQIGTQ